VHICFFILGTAPVPADITFKLLLDDLSKGPELVPAYSQPGELFVKLLQPGLESM